MESKNTASSQEMDHYVVAHQQLRSSIQAVTHAAAREAGIQINIDHIVYLSSEEGSVANIPIANIEKLSLEEIANGANLMFVHIAPSEEAILGGSNQSLPTGFYAVRAIGVNVAGLYNSAGQRMAEVPLMGEIIVDGQEVPSPIAVDHPPKLHARVSAHYHKCFYLDLYLDRWPGHPLVYTIKICLTHPRGGEQPVQA